MVSTGQKAALRGEINRILESEGPPVSNLTKKERKVLNELKNDENIVFLEADKGRSIVIMDKEEYTTKMETKLSDTTTYQRLQEDPTPKIQSKLWKKLESWKEKEHISGHP